jgi:nucleoside 2-deoxyribosyltransferase
MKIYLGGPMFDLPNVRYNLDLAKRIRTLGYDVYCPNENASINDKTRTDITPERVYQADVDELIDANIFLCQVAEDSGTMWEAGFMDCLARHVDAARYLGVIGLATDIRLATSPDPRKIGADNQAWAINAFVSGGLKSSLGLYLNEDDLFVRLGQLLGDAR